MPRSTQGDFAFKFGGFALYFFESCKIHTLVREFAPTALPRITRFVCAASVHVVYDIVNATVPRLVDMAVFFVLETNPGPHPIYPGFVWQTSGLVRVVVLQ